MTKPPSILVLIHPGSCCGSANFNLGSAACGYRDAIIHDLDRHDGGIVVIDGGLSDEIDDYPVFRDTIARSMERAAGAGHMAVRVFGCAMEDFNQVDAMEAVVRSHGLQPGLRINLTGAWADENDGCVTSVANMLIEKGFSIDVLDSAMTLDERWCSDEDQDAEEEALAA